VLCSSAPLCASDGALVLSSVGFSSSDSPACDVSNGFASPLLLALPEAVWALEA